MLCDQISNLKASRCFRRFSRIKWAAWAYFGLAALPISTYAQVQTIVPPNNRRKDFYDILQNVKDRTIDDFWTRMLKFAKIAFFYVLLTTMTNYFTRVWTLRRREAMSFDYIKYWRNVKSTLKAARNVSKRISTALPRRRKI